MASSAALRERQRTLVKLLCNLSHSRAMGGGPRTFPGGLNKWQYKRMHEKMAREKERHLLHQEKQLYFARLRSEIRAKIGGKQPPPSDDASGTGPMSSKDHIKALADRFMKAGAEDLWNKDDGPLFSSSQRPPTRPSDRTGPLDLRQIVSDGRRRSGGSLPSFQQKREYSVMAGRRPSPNGKSKWRRNSSSDEGSDSDYDLEIFQKSNADGKKGSRFPRISTETGVEMEEETDLGDARIRRKKMMSSAALMNIDMKKERWRLRSFEEEDKISDQIQAIRDELKKKEAFGSDFRRPEVKEESLLTQKRFDECNISPLTVKALVAAGYSQLTVVQEAAIPVCLEGKDVLVKARTGTGKTAAFLLPAIETVLKATSSNINQRVPPIVVLILCPTRELAIQIAAETNVLLKYHDGIGVQTLIGGTRFKLDQKRLESNPCQIIVATPGRLLDHIENKSGFSVRLMGLKLIILDEADYLLDLGFRKDIEKIVDCIPRQRQSLLFSATMPKEVRRISQLVLNRDHEFVDTVGLGGLETHAKVSQSYLVAPHGLHFFIVYHLLKEHIMQVVDYKNPFIR
ncbi:RNA helicase protein [Dioscorea alata]|uniref:RNA helicase protein n=1 Tax=Dioscorea alata TaxID=55571 RepID=A0ACB7V7R9_DIOAL|nr:RNA helicase protein [Dioscorea alata]